MRNDTLVAFVENNKEYHILDGKISADGKYLAGTLCMPNYRSYPKNIFYHIDGDTLSQKAKSFIVYSLKDCKILFNKVYEYEPDAYFFNNTVFIQSMDSIGHWLDIFDLINKNYKQIDFQFNELHFSDNKIFKIKYDEETLDFSVFESNNLCFEDLFKIQYKGLINVSYIHINTNEILCCLNKPDNIIIKKSTKTGVETLYKFKYIDGFLVDYNNFFCTGVKDGDTTRCLYYYDDEVGDFINYFSIDKLENYYGNVSFYITAVCKNNQMLYFSTYNSINPENNNLFVYNILQKSFIKQTKTGHVYGPIGCFNN